MSLGGELPAKSSALQAALFLLLLCAHIGVSFALRQTESEGAKLGTIALVAHVLVLAALYTGLVLVLLRAFRQSLTTLGLGRMPLSGVVAFGLLGVVMAYAVNVLAVVIYLVITRPSLTALGEHKLAALDPLAALPVALVLPLALLVGVYEELAFRGFLLSRLRAAFAAPLGPRAAAIAAALLSSAAFAVGHGYQGVLGIAQTAAAGVAFSMLALWRKSIWPCIFAHISIDVFGLFALRVLRPALESVTHGT